MGQSSSRSTPSSASAVPVTVAAAPAPATAVASAQTRNVSVSSRVVARSSKAQPQNQHIKTITTRNKRMIQIFHGSLAVHTADVIVNSITRSYVTNAGLSKILHDAAGAAMKEEGQRVFTEMLQSRGPTCKLLDSGDVMVTGAGQLPAKFLMHAVCPDKGDPNLKSILFSMVEKVLVRAEERGCATVAFPAFGSGGFGIALTLSLECIVKALLKFCGDNTIKSVKAIHLVDMNVEVTKQFAEVFQATLAAECKELLKLGHELIEGKEYETAESVLQQALDLDQSNTEAMEMLATIYSNNWLLNAKSTLQQRRRNECLAFLYFEMLANLEDVKDNIDLAFSYRNIIARSAAAGRGARRESVDSDFEEEDDAEEDDGVYKPVQRFDHLRRDETTQLEELQATLGDDPKLFFVFQLLLEGRAMLEPPTAGASAETVAQRFLRFANAGVLFEKTAVLFTALDREDLAAVAHQSIALMYVRGHGVDISDQETQSSADSQAIEYFRYAPFNPIALFTNAKLLDEKRTWYQKSWIERRLVMNSINELLQMAVDGMYLPAIQWFADRMFEGVGVDDFESSEAVRYETWRHARDLYSKFINVYAENKRKEAELMMESDDEGADAEQFLVKAKDRVELITTALEKKKASSVLATPSLPLAVAAFQEIYRQKFKGFMVAYVTYHLAVALIKSVDPTLPVPETLNMVANGPLDGLVSTVRANFRVKITRNEHHVFSDDEAENPQAPQADQKNTEITSMPAEKEEATAKDTIRRQIIPQQMHVQLVARKLKDFVDNAENFTSAQSQTVATELLKVVNLLLADLQVFEFDELELDPVAYLERFLQKHSCVHDIQFDCNVGADADEEIIERKRVQPDLTGLKQYVLESGKVEQSWDLAVVEACLVFAAVEPGRRHLPHQIEVYRMAKLIAPICANDQRGFEWDAQVAVLAYDLLHEVHHTDDDSNVMFHGRSARCLLLQAEQLTGDSSSGGGSSSKSASSTSVTEMSMPEKIVVVRRSLDAVGQQALKNSLSPDFGSFARIGYHVILTLSKWSKAIEKMQHVGDDQAMLHRKQAVQHLVESGIGTTWLEGSEMDRLLRGLLGINCNWEKRMSFRGDTTDLVALDQLAIEMVQKAEKHIEQSEELQRLPQLNYARLTYADPYSFLFTKAVKDEFATKLAMINELADALGDEVSKDELTVVVLQSELEEIFKTIQTKVLPSPDDMKEELAKVFQVATRGYAQHADRASLVMKFLFMLNKTVDWSKIQADQASADEKADALYLFHTFMAGMEGRCPDGIAVYLQDWLVKYVSAHASEFSGGTFAVEDDEQRTVVMLQLVIAAFMTDVRNRFIGEHLTPFRHGRNGKSYEARTTMQLVLEQMLRLPLSLPGDPMRCKFSYLALDSISGVSQVLALNITNLMKEFLCGGFIEFEDHMTERQQDGTLNDGGEAKVRLPIHAVTLKQLAADLRSCWVEVRKMHERYEGVEEWRHPSAALSCVISTTMIEDFFCHDVVLAPAWADFQASFNQRSNRFFDGSKYSKDLREITRDAAIVRILEIAGYVKVPLGFYDKVPFNWTLPESTLDFNPYIRLKLLEAQVREQAALNARNEEEETE